MLDTVTELEIDVNFKPITIGQPLIPLPDDIINDLSTDQSYAYRIVAAIRSGVIPRNLELLEIGPVCHSRWLTTACRLCRLWMSKHSLYGKSLKSLEMITEFVVGVYFPCWFEIKVKNSWLEGPRHVLFQLDQLRHQKEEVVNIVLPTVKRSSWFAFSEFIIQTLLCSKDKEERRQGIKEDC